MRGQTPYLMSSGSWKKLTMVGIMTTTPEGRRSKLFIRTIAGALTQEETICFLKDLKQHLHGKRLLLIWDGLPAHRARTVTAYVKSQHAWLRTARLPSYAPEVNPIEYCWGAMKKKHLGNLRAEGMEKLGRAIQRAKYAMNDSTLLHGFLKASGLY